jgi:hypothetical protein
MLRSPPRTVLCMMPLGSVLESGTGRSERMLEGLLGGIGGSSFYRLLWVEASWNNAETMCGTGRGAR